MTTRSVLSARALAVALLALVAGGCLRSVDPAQMPVGDYHSTQIVINPEEPGLDTLSAQGVSLAMSLHADGTVTGHVVAPESNYSETTIRGTWTATGNMIHFRTNQIYWLDNQVWLSGNGELQTMRPGNPEIVMSR
ncbi:MAG: hypothetical protein JST22_08340 [Bacteroidetes bacterium]|nr:hypothetical protein [Bacteroidota bacterium]